MIHNHRYRKQRATAVFFAGPFNRTGPFMHNTRHLLLSLLLALLIIVSGSAGYMIMEGWTFIDALYMTVITVSTVGFSEVHPVSAPGRLYTIVVVLLGVGFNLYVAGAVVQFMVEGRIRILLGRRRLEKKIDRLKNHYIVCGYGRIGRTLCKNLRRKPLGLVVIDKNRDLAPIMDADGILYMNGNSAEESILLKCGIRRARGLVAALATDTDNVFLVLTARQLNPDLFILARAGSQEAKAKLRAAGADIVESPYDMGAISMAQRILRPTVTSFINLAVGYQRQDIQMEEIPVNTASRLTDVMLKDSGIRQNFNLIIIAIKKKDGSMQFNPSSETVIQAGDTVIAVGKPADLEKLETALHPDAAG